MTKKRKNIFFIILMVIFFIMFIYSSIKIIIWYMDNQTTKEIKDKVNKEIVIKEKDEIKVDNQRLKEISPNTVGYININNTEINYPFVQGKDNDFYLNHNIYDDHSGTGWIFADYRNKLDGTDKNIILYGHARQDGSMFGSLTNISKKEWYLNEKNWDIDLFLNGNKYQYRVFSFYQVKPENYYLRTNINNYNKFINTLLDRSEYNFNNKIDKDTPILTLSTCTAGDNYRFVVHAYQIK